MFRRSFGLLAALLFVLCTGLVTMWVREEPRVPSPPPIPPRVLAQIQANAAFSMRSRPPDVDLAKPMGRLPPFKGCQLRDVLDWLSGVDAGSVEANWPAIEAAGIRQMAPVPRDAAANGTFGSALADVLSPMGLAFATDGHLVYVSTPADVARFGHMRHVDRFTFTTQADTITAAALGSERNFIVSRRPSIRLETDWQALRDAGIEFRTPIWWYSSAPTGMGLEALLRQASGTTPLRYEIRDGGVVISTAAALESADRDRTWVIVTSTIGFLVAFFAVTFLAQRRPGLRRFLCVALVLIAAATVSVPIWQTRPDAFSVRLGRSRWTVGLGPQRTFVLSQEPARLEEVFMSHRSGGPGRAVYWDRLGFYAAREGPPYQIFNTRAPRWAVIVLVGTVPFIWAASKVPAVFNLPRTLRERRRARAGQCIRCGYDLRGCPSDRCPECGRSA